MARLRSAFETTLFRTLHQECCLLQALRRHGKNVIAIGRHCRILSSFFQPQITLNSAQQYAMQYVVASYKTPLTTSAVLSIINVVGAMTSSLCKWLCRISRVFFHSFSIESVSASVHLYHTSLKYSFVFQSGL